MGSAMSNPNRMTYVGPLLSGPGIIWVNSVPMAPLSESVFNKWYEEVHIVEIIKAGLGSGSCIAAWRFKCQEASRFRPCLALYAVSNMPFVHSPGLVRVSQHYVTLPEGEPSQKFVDFDTRFYQRIQVLQKSEEKIGIGKVIKSTAIEPGLGMTGI